MSGRENIFLQTRPDVRQYPISAAYAAGEHLLVLVKDAPLLAARCADALSCLSYLDALAGINTERGIFKYFVTLERAPDGPFLCAFTDDGGHRNFGERPDLKAEQAFLYEAAERALDYLGQDDAVRVNFNWDSQPPAASSSS